MKAFYVDPEGKRWRISNLRPSFVARFVDATREDNVPVSLLDSRIQFED